MMKLFTYDHCPYCVRARLVLGLKKMPFEHVVLLNDDEATPIRKVGRKMVPILETDDGTCMPESMDIVRYVDHLDGAPLLVEAKEDPALADWRSRSGDVMRALLYPRWVNAPLAEFATEPARAYFIRKKTESIGDFEAALANTPALQLELESLLVALEPSIQSPDAVHGERSYADIDLFGHLRGITLIKDLKIPAGVRAYLDTLSRAGSVPLYDEMAR
jgi:glutaredoxin 2